MWRPKRKSVLKLHQKSEIESVDDPGRTDSVYTRSDRAPRVLCGKLYMIFKHYSSSTAICPWLNMSCWIASLSPSFGFQAPLLSCRYMNALRRDLKYCQVTDFPRIRCECTAWTRVPQMSVSSQVSGFWGYDSWITYLIMFCTLKSKSFTSEDTLKLLHRSSS